MRTSSMSDSTVKFWEDQLIESEKALEQYLKWLDSDPDNATFQKLAKDAGNEIEQITKLIKKGSSMIFVRNIPHPLAPENLLAGVK